MGTRPHMAVSGGAGRAPSHILTQTASRPHMRYHLFDTEIGLCGIAWSDDGVTRFRLPDPNRDAAERALGGKAETQAPPPHVANVIGQAQRYFAGERIDFAATALDLAGVDPFRRTIYDALRAVGWGETVTYGELAKRAGSPGTAQDVGVAMARNPVPLIIPCHRVLAAGGKLGGFSAPGRTEAKQRMLALEGVFIDNQPRLL
jgi:methylated-DNA-[protein]-cysteine S-methyltransferase